MDESTDADKATVLNINVGSDTAADLVVYFWDSGINGGDSCWGLYIV